MTVPTHQCAVQHWPVALLAQHHHTRSTLSTTATAPRYPPIQRREGAVKNRHVLVSHAQLVLDSALATHRLWVPPMSEQISPVKHARGRQPLPGAPTLAEGLVLGTCALMHHKGMGSRGGAK